MAFPSGQDAGSGANPANEICSNPLGALHDFMLSAPENVTEEPFLRIEALRLLLTNCVIAAFNGDGDVPRGISWAKSSVVGTRDETLTHPVVQIPEK